MQPTVAVLYPWRLLRTYTTLRDSTFVRSQTFTPRDFVIDAKGACRLHPELARRIAALDTGSAERTLQVTQAVQFLRVLSPEGGQE